MEHYAFKEIESHKKKGLLIYVKCEQVFLFAGIFMEVLLSLNVLLSCASTFDCAEFLPTISYLACFRGHDRLFSFTMAYWGSTLLAFNFAAFLQLQTASVWFNRVFFVLGVGISLAQPFLAIFDEANTSYYAKIEVIHSVLIISLILSVLLWVYLSILTEKVGLTTVCYLQFVLMLLVLSVLQWFYAESSQTSFSYKTEALSEWAVVSAAVFLPYFYSRGFQPMIIHTKVRSE